MDTDLLREALHRPAVLHRPGCAEGDLLDRLARDDSFMECSCGGTSQFHAALASQPEPRPLTDHDLPCVGCGEPTRSRTDDGTPRHIGCPTRPGLREAAAFMLELVDQYYGTDHEFDIPEEAEFRRHRRVIEYARLSEEPR